MNNFIRELSLDTGFPPEALVDFAERGLLPRAETPPVGEPTFNGCVLLRTLEELNRGQ